jgi:hypothetical protein
MRIASSTINLSSTHLAAEHSTRQESLRTWVGDRRPDFEALEKRQGRGLSGREGGGEGRGPVEDGEECRATNARRIAGLAHRLEREAAGLMRHAMKDAESAGSAGGPSNDVDGDELQGDPKTIVIKLLVEAMTGKKIKLISMSEIRDVQASGQAASAEIQQAAQQQQRVGWGLEYDLHETHDEIEQTSFSAEGVIKTADGKELTFSYELELERLFHSETNVSVRAGDATLNDPLVINFHGTAAQLTDKKYAFDLDADGKQDRVSWVGPNSGFLALDKNGNGTIDDGSELFGAKTGNGFAELAAYDDDKNGWIDENDAVFNRLQVWTKSGDVDVHASLKDRNVGAISLSSIATPFEMKNPTNQLQGAVRSSGIFVKEDGRGVGSVQQIDLAV